MKCCKLCHLCIIRLTYICIHKCSFTFAELYLNISIHCDWVGGLQKISQGYHMWYWVQNMSKYDIYINEQPLNNGVTCEHTTLL